MPTRLKLSEQRRLYDALPQCRKTALRKHCQSCQMRGDGIKDIFKSIGKVLGPIAKEIGPTVLKEIVIPLLKKKIDGKGISLPGGTLRLAGQGRKKRKTK